FIAACNANDVIPRFMEKGELTPQPSVATLSNAMDVGDPSNFVRILEIFNSDFPALKDKLESVSVSDEVTAATMHEIYEKTGYILDPHGAVGYRALADYLEGHPGDKGIFLETAHPVKFDSVGAILDKQIEVPAELQSLFKNESKSIKIQPYYEQLRVLIENTT
ncbi:MAG TPA: hypothetical protein VK612_06485, partial [Pyrinomonadaceae bacterium]|nr:hypothetical protein [Pyrinomonadaceae bacterium]